MKKSAIASVLLTFSGLGAPAGDLDWLDDDLDWAPFEQYETIAAGTLALDCHNFLAEASKGNNPSSECARLIDKLMNTEYDSGPVDNLRRRYCHPEEASVEQAVRVVVAYLE